MRLRNRPRVSPRVAGHAFVCLTFVKVSRRRAQPFRSYFVSKRHELLLLVLLLYGLSLDGSVDAGYTTPDQRLT